MQNFQEMYDILRTKVNCLAGKKSLKGDGLGTLGVSNLSPRPFKPLFLDDEDDEDDTFRLRIYDPAVGR